MALALARGAEAPGRAGLARRPWDRRQAIHTVRGVETAQAAQNVRRLSAGSLVARADSPVEVEYYANGGILNTVLRAMVR